ncbi:MAG TPA: hypothetical protein VM557_08170 [Thermoanaerobaculia bacterium]|nr:hypothetical protein [Thermoanaerobaculia bacterium]
MIRRHEAAARNLRLALELFEAGEQLKRQSIRRMNPDATDAEIEEKIVEWLRDRPGALHGDCPGRTITLAELSSRCNRG